MARAKRHPVPGLRDFRELAARTQAELAAGIDKSPSFISHLENGRAAASENVLVQLAACLGIEPEDLTRR